MGRFDELVGIVARLRGEGGCPWDRAQSLESMRPYLLEETYEVLDAIDRGEELQEELGDLAFQVVFLARLAEEAGRFGMDDVLQRINRKMVDRHPHVFEAGAVRTGDEGDVAAWEARKARERGGVGSALDGVPPALPALLRAHRISEKAGAVGFDWPDAAGVRAKLTEEVAELDQAMAGGNPIEIAEELGDVLFTLVNLGRHLPTGAEDALRMATARFEARFRVVEAELAAQGRTVYETPADELEARWRAAKRAAPLSGG